MTADLRRVESPHLISVVVPVYRGEHSLPVLLDEILPWTKGFVTSRGHDARIAEVLLVHDHGPDDSAQVIRELAAARDVVRPVWLSRNFGQHAATLAGMASSGGDWIVTLDEDGQHDPAEIGSMLDVALAGQASVVYAEPQEQTPARSGAQRSFGRCEVADRQGRRRRRVVGLPQLSTGTRGGGTQRGRLRRCRRLPRHRPGLGRR
ncbi:MAG: glycosyltransferase [Nocardioidaceae bacterium]